MRRILLGRALVLATLAAAVATRVHAQDLSSSNYQILAPVITAGGGYATSNSYSLLGVISEFAHELSNSLSFGSVPGFAAYPFVSTPIVTATGGNASVALSWTAAGGVLGYSVGGYTVGQATISGGPYTFADAGSALSSTISGLTNGTSYYFIIRVRDAYNSNIATSSEVSATPVAPPPPPPPPPPATNTSGGSVSSVSTVSLGTASVSFSGRAYPRSTITLLKDSQIVVSTVADANAEFAMSLSGMSAGSFVFSIYGQDSTGNRSALLSFPVTLTAGASTHIGGIFISPTIDVDKSEVKKGDNLVIFGQSHPQSDIVIAVHSSTELFLKSRSDAIGAYLYNLDTSPLELGSHSAQSKAAALGQISDFGNSVAFAVGLQNVEKKQTPTCIPADLNCDGRVNLIDFSIMAYWYQRTLTAAGMKADLTHDGKVNLVDFSILASHWTS